VLNFKTITSSLILASLPLSSVSADLAELAKRIYFGAGVSYSSGSYEGLYSDTFTSTLASFPGTSLSAYSNSSSMGGQFYVGYPFNKNLALEVGYIKFLKSSYYFGIQYQGNTNPGSVSLSTSGLEYSLVFHPSFGTHLDHFFGRLGGTYLQKDTASSNSQGFAPASSSNGTGWLWGVGYDYPINDQLTIRTEYLGLRRISGLSNYNLNSIGVGVAGRF